MIKHDLEILLNSGGKMLSSAYKLIFSSLIGIFSCLLIAAKWLREPYWPEKEFNNPYHAIDIDTFSLHGKVFYNEDLHIAIKNIPPITRDMKPPVQFQEDDELDRDAEEWYKNIDVIWSPNEQSETYKLFNGFKELQEEIILSDIPAKGQMKQWLIFQKSCLQ